MLVLPMQTHPTAVTCVLCRNLVSLETAKADEIGRTVHETCYVERLLARQSLIARAAAAK